MARLSQLLLGILLLLPVLTGCERERVTMTGPTPQSAGAGTDATSALVLLEQAQDALAKQDYQRCASRFAAAAKVSSEDEAAICWYRASQCAAQSGDYRLSGFHMQTAASAGFANLSRLRADPLLRPLQSGPRWLLIDDTVYNNQIAHSAAQQEQTLCQVGGESSRLAQLDAPY